jgi:hypothetical protein
MRSDMKKVVTERPRSGGGVKTPKGEKRIWQHYTEDELPKRERIRAKWERSYGAKNFTDVLGPLYRYLLHQVGRPWDVVYSEIAANLPKTSLQNRHVYTHLWEFVEKNVILIDGVACHQGDHSHGLPIRSSGRYAQLFINPATGLLCKAKKGKRLAHYRWPEREVYQPGIKAYPGVQYHKLKGDWYEVKVRKFEPTPNPFGHLAYPTSIKDEVLDRTYHDVNQLARVYGGKYIAVSKRQLKKREIKFACLT